MFVSFKQTNTDVKTFEDKLANIKVSSLRYQTLPVPCHAQDVKKCEGAALDVEKIMVKVQNIVKKLTFRKTELFDSNAHLQKWASNENGYIESKLEVLKDLEGEFLVISNNLNHVMRLLKSRFTTTDARVADNKRKAIREKEYRRQKRRRQADKEKRSAYKILCLAYDEEVADEFLQGDLSKGFIKISVLKKCSLKPRLHLSGLKYLLTKGVFMEEETEDVQELIIEMDHDSEAESSE